jgi:hypothetical protein
MSGDAEDEGVSAISMKSCTGMWIHSCLGGTTDGQGNPAGGGSADDFNEIVACPSQTDACVWRGEDCNTRITISAIIFEKIGESLEVSERMCIFAVSNLKHIEL